MANARKGYVIALAPDRTSLTLFGYVKVAGISAQAGIEGDEALTEKLSKEGTYKLVKSGPITISGHDGFMTESKFLIANSSERHRLRVYFNANGALYVLCFDAMPPTQWDEGRFPVNTEFHQGNPIIEPDPEDDSSWKSDGF